MRPTCRQVVLTFLSLEYLHPITMRIKLQRAELHKLYKLYKALKSWRDSNLRSSVLMSVTMTTTTRRQGTYQADVAFVRGQFL
jgi:hypothetical protein